LVSTLFLKMGFFSTAQTNSVKHQFSIRTAGGMARMSPLIRRMWSRTFCKAVAEEQPVEDGDRKAAVQHSSANTQPR
jgi:hypothetical protein